MSSQNNTGYFPQMPICDKLLSVEVNSDFSLPDYQPEIRRLLSSRVSVLPPSEYIGNGNASLSGEVSYRILYLGADGKLYSATLGDSFSVSVPFEFDSHSINTDDVTLICAVQSDSVNTRVLGPRKLNVRTRLSCHAFALSPSLYTPELVGAHNDSRIENRIFETPCVYTLKCSGEPTSLTDFIPLDSQLDNVRIIDYSSKALISECVASDGKINVKGEVLLKLLHCNDAKSELPITTARKLPFSITLDCDGADSSFECSAVGYTYDEKIEINESGIGIELLLSVCVRAQKNVAVPYISDAYSTERESECEKERVTLMSALKCANTNLTQNEVLTLEDISLPPDAKIIDTRGNCSVDEVDFKEGKLHIRGKSDYQLLYCHDEEFGVKEISAPWHSELDCRGVGTSEPGKVKASVCAGIPTCRSRHDGERLFIDGELCFALTAQREHDIEILSKMIFGNMHDKTSGEFILCFPEKDAEIWDIAKRYGESERKICAQNSISEGEETVKKKFLII